MVSKHPKKSIREKKPSTSTPFVSVIIPCYNAHETLHESVLSALRQDFDSFETIVVDDGSTDASAQILGQLHQEYPELKVITQKNQGAGGARNTGFAAARGKILLMLDTDAKVFPGWISQHVAMQAKGFPVVGGSVVPWDDGFWGKCDYYSTWYEYYPQKKFQRDRHQISSTNLSISREVFEKTNGFDPALRKRLEDVDFSIRLHRLGYAIAFEPSIPMAHHDRQTFWGWLRHHYWYGRIAPFVRTRENGARFAWLMPESQAGALLMILPLAFLHTGFVLYHWFPRRLDAWLFSPFIFLSKCAHAVGVYDGVKEKLHMRAQANKK